MEAVVAGRDAGSRLAACRLVLDRLCRLYDLFASLVNVEIPTSANSPCESRYNEFAGFIVYGQQIQDKLVFCCFKTMKSTYDTRGKSLKYVKLRIGNLLGIPFLCGNRGLVINCKN